MSLWGMAAYSIDLRHKILQACARRLGSQHALADLFGVSLSFVEQLRRRHRTTGSIAPKPHAGGQKPSLDAAADALVRQLVHAHAEMTLEELCARVTAERGVRVSVATMCRVLQRLGFPRNKSRSMRQRAIHRAPARERVVGSVPRHYGPTVPMLGAVSVQGLQALMTVDGPTEADVFRASVQQGLGPTLPPGAIVVMANLQAHKAVGVQQALARRGARLLSWPPDSPDLSPIEPCWSKLKTALRKVKARTRAVLDAAIAEAMVAVSPTDAWNWVKHCGYPVH